MYNDMHCPQKGSLQRLDETQIANTVYLSLQLLLTCTQAEIVTKDRKALIL
jgi:hypothetical protein